MYRAIPVSSKFLAKKELKEEQRRHEEKLKVIMKSKSEYFSKDKPKKIQRNERFWKDKENAIKDGNLKLIMKIEGIVHPDPTATVLVSLNHQQQGRQSAVKSRGAFRRTDAFTSGSLPSTGKPRPEYKKRQQMLKIALDNVSMRNRILDCSAYYKVKDYKDHMATHKNLVQMHCEYPLILEKKSDKPSSSYVTRGSTAHLGSSTQITTQREGNSTDQKPRQFKISKGKDLSKSNLTSEGFFRDADKQPETETPKVINIASNRETPKRSQIQPEQIPKSTANAVLMTRHFLHDDIIIIYEDVVQLNKQLYHCSLTKPQ